MLFPEPSNDPEDDRLFAEALERAGNVSLGQFNSYTRRDNYTQTHVVEPVPVLKQAAARTGFVNQFADNDGIVRFGYQYLEGAPSLANSGCLAAREGSLPCQAGDEQVFLIDFKSKSVNIPVISYYQVINHLVDPDFFAGKYVFVGLGSDVKVDAQGAVDAFPTPFFRFTKKMMYGVEIHAHVLVTLLTGCQLQMWEPLWIPVIFALIALLPVSIRKQPYTLYVTGLGSILGLGGVSWALFNFQGLMLDITPAVLAVGVNTLMLGLNEFRKTRVERQYIKQAFENYVSTDIVNMLIDNPSALTLGGERRELTVMFADINGFTTVSEGLQPEELVTALNNYLQLITQAILSHNGTLDKYIGDAVMCFFGAPVHFEDHGARACASAVYLDTLLNQGEKPPEAVFKGITLGINTGDMIVGNVGSENRFDFTVIGDAVNLASRLEALNKAYGTSVIIGENTRRSLPAGAFLTRELDYVKVKGKHTAVAIYELMPDTTENRQGRAIPFARGLALYRSRDWKAAEAVFRDILHHYPSDGPAKVFVERCRYFSQNSPGENWDMVWEMKVK
jgi:adenylate cyclase